MILVDPGTDLAELQRTVEHVAGEVAAALNRVLGMLPPADFETDDPVTDIVFALRDALEEIEDLPDDTARLIDRATR